MQIALTIIAVLLIVCVLLQQKESSLGSMAGTDTGSQIVQSRRGPEKVLHLTTIVLFALFLALGLVTMVF